MSTQVRIGVIGTSWWADSMLLPALTSHPQAAVVALCGRNQERAQSLATKFAIPQMYADYRQMYEEARLDAVVIATPDDTHYEMTMHALDARLHVLCEKPLALNVAQARAMLARAEASGRQHMTYFTYRWLPQTRYLFELIADGYFGVCYHGYFRWFMKYPAFAIDGWRARPDQANGVLADLGSHLIDLACCAWPAAGTGQRRRGGDVAICRRRLWRRPGEYDGTHGWSMGGLAGAPAWGARFVRTQPRPGWSARLVWGAAQVGCRLFIDAILERRPRSKGTWPSFSDGLKAQEVIAAALESTRRGCWVAPATVGELSEDS
jgi:predicted dehydrogenase